MKIPRITFREPMRKNPLRSAPKNHQERTDLNTIATLCAKLFNIVSVYLGKHVERERER